MTEALRLAVVDDYDVVVAGVAHIFSRYRDRIEVVELAADEPVSTEVDIALFDTFAQGEADAEELDILLANPLAHRVVVFTWVFRPEVVALALEKGVAGYLSKTLPAEQLVTALERIHRGEVVVSDPPRHHRPTGQDWPGRDEGLSQRESEVLALITQGRTNAEISEITYLSPNTVKTHIRSCYAKIGVTSRSQAVLWGVEHGLNAEVRIVSNWLLPG